MKRFQFRLDSILKIRAREEDSAREALERCLNAQRNAERNLVAANLRLDQREETIVGKCAGKMSIQEYLILLEAVRTEREHCVDLTARLVAVTRETDTSRKLFQEARRRHQAILRLHDRHSRAHADAEQRREENEIADFIISRHLPPESRACA